MLLYHKRYILIRVYIAYKLFQCPCPLLGTPSFCFAVNWLVIFNNHSLYAHMNALAHTQHVYAIGVFTNPASLCLSNCICVSMRDSMSLSVRISAVLAYTARGVCMSLLSCMCPPIALLNGSFAYRLHGLYVHSRPACMRPIIIGRPLRPIQSV